MKNNTIPKIVLNFIVFTFLGSTGYSQTLLREIPLGIQIENSSLVVEGKVLAKKSFWDLNRNNIYTMNTLEVLKVFKGEYVGQIEVVTIGGTVGTEALIVSPSLKLQTGDVGIFTLENNRTTLDATSKSNNKKYKPYASIQSFYKYSLYDGRVVNSYSKNKKSKISFYEEIMSHTKSNYIQVSELVKSNNGTKKGLLAPTDISFDLLSASAGTKTVLTISGTDFGGIQGKVGFSNADDGGATSVFALDSQVLSWNNTTITVEIPSQAGTGPIVVQDNLGGNGFSSSDLIIDWAESNAVIDPDDATGQDPPGTDGPLGLHAYPTRHFDENGSGGYTWEMQTDFFNNTDSKAGFENALDQWRCQTKVNWVISDTPTSTDVIAADGVNVIRYDIPGVDDLDPGVLGQCLSRVSGCGFIGNVSSWDFRVIEMDIVFDSGTTWYFGNGLPNTGFDFESVALHELGHGHQLGHVIDNSAQVNNGNDVMNFNLAPFEQQRVFSEGNVNAANNVHSRSKSFNGVIQCTQPVMTNSTICNLNVDEVDLNTAISIFPNPSNGQFFIKNASFLNLEQVIIYDAWGRQISTHQLSDDSTIKTINLRGVAKGMYFVKMFSSSISVSRKIILN